MQHVVWCWYGLALLHGGTAAHPADSASLPGQPAITKLQRSLQFVDVDTLAVHQPGLVLLQGSAAAHPADSASRPGRPATARKQFSAACGFVAVDMLHATSQWYISPPR
jgi:hypothetical protein